MKERMCSKEMTSENTTVEKCATLVSDEQKEKAAKKLTERMLSKLIEHIEVHQAEKTDGVYHQKVTICYNCVDAIEIPTTLTLPEITMQTRKGRNGSLRTPARSSIKSKVSLQLKCCKDTSMASLDKIDAKAIVRAKKLAPRRKHGASCVSL